MYRESQIDKDNIKWFNQDKTVNSLKRISITNGHIRGIFPMDASFQYPITAFVGENGSGKSTLLALIACSFHNTTDFCPSSKKRTTAKKVRPYYTYGDFFTFLPSENGISSIQIQAEYLSSSGTKYDIRKKKPSGKWNDYNGRPSRIVSFLGINRIVPPSESSPHRHYSKLFSVSNNLTDGQIEELRKALSQILGRSYSKINLMEYGMYRLFSAQRNETEYTGFNMGAGENAVLGLLLEIMSAGKGSLIVVDEIELGLHAKAQKQLIEVLKDFCKQYHCQVVCSTHSKMILDSLPPEARFFIRRNDKKTDIIPKISSEYAFGQLSGTHGTELKIFVEDDVGKAFLQNSLSLSLRERVQICPIGSDQAVLKHMAVHYRENDRAFLAFLDGDKRDEKTSAIGKIKKHLEDRIGIPEEEFQDIFEKRLQYLPGSVWPEKYLIDEGIRQDCHNELCNQWNTSEDRVVSFLEQALIAGKHAEFYSLAQNLELEEDQVRRDIIKVYKQTHNEEIAAMESAIQELLANEH